MCLVDHANLQAGQRVFINGGSGGTGLWGIQVRLVLEGARDRLRGFIDRQRPRGTCRFDLFRAVAGADPPCGSGRGTYRVLLWQLVKLTLRFQVVDYRAVDLVDHLKANYSSPEKQFDIIYDCAGFNTALYPSSPAYLKPAGFFVDICAMATPKETGGRVQSFARLLGRTWRPSWLGGTPRRYKSALLLAHNSVRPFSVS